MKKNLLFLIPMVLVAILLFILYCKLSDQKLSFSFSLGRLMFSKSKYYIIDGETKTISPFLYSILVLGNYSESGN